MNEEYEKPDIIVTTLLPEQEILNISETAIDPIYNNPFQDNEDW